MNFPNRQLRLMYEALLLGKVIMEVEERDDLYIAMGVCRASYSVNPHPTEPTAILELDQDEPDWSSPDPRRTGRLVLGLRLGGRQGSREGRGSVM